MCRDSVECNERVQGKCGVCADRVWSIMSVFRESVQFQQR